MSKPSSWPSLRMLNTGVSMVVPTRSVPRLSTMSSRSAVSPRAGTGQARASVRSASRGRSVTGAIAVAGEAVPDGRTLFVAPPGALDIKQAVCERLSYEPDAFVPISVLGAVPNVAIVREKLPVDALEAVIAHMKANEGKVSYGSQRN